MSTFQLMTEMFLLDNGCRDTCWRDKLVEQFRTEELEGMAIAASQKVTLNLDEVINMSDLYMLVHGEQNEVSYLATIYPELDAVLDKMWLVLDSDKLDQETDNG